MNEPPADRVSDKTAGDQTTLHARRAGEGDPSSLDWLVARFSPLLRAQASYRLGARLGRIYEPEDIVDDAWLVALPRIEEILARPGRRTPVLLRFLGTTVRNRIMTLARRHLGGDALARAAELPSSSGVEGISAEASGVVTRAIRRELHDAVTKCLLELDPDDRAVILLRGVEQLSAKAASLLLGASPEAVAMRYHRALVRLRARLPGTVFDEL